MTRRFIFRRNILKPVVSSVVFRQASVAVARMGRKRWDQLDASNRLYLAGAASITIAGFLTSIVTGFVVLGLILLIAGLVLDLLPERNT